MTLLNYQWAINGLVFGAGTAYEIGDVDGLGRQVRSNDQDRGNGDGSVIGPDFLEPRTVVHTVTIKGSSESDVMVKLAALQRAWTTRGPERKQLTANLQWKHPGLPQQVLIGGRPRRLTPALGTVALGWIRVLTEYYAPDPRVYADVERTVDLSIGGASQALPNAGDHPAPVWWDVYGAVTNPALIRSETARFDLTAAIANGAFYRIRTDPRTVTRSTDSANRYQDISGAPALQSPFLEVPAGGASFRAVGTGAGAAAKIRATYRDTWSG